MTFNHTLNRSSADPHLSIHYTNTKVSEVQPNGETAMTCYCYYE